MVAYAAIISLTNTIEQTLHHAHHLSSLERENIESLRETVNFLLEFLEGGSNVEEGLENRIVDAAHAAEDLIESNFVDQTLAGPTSQQNDKGSIFFYQKILQDMDSIKKEVQEIKEGDGIKDVLPRSVNSSRALPNGKDRMVGFDDELIRVLEILTCPQPVRRIFPIVGMGGIGKTTLARNVYDHPLIVQHFVTRAWVTISQEYNLYKGLSGRRYLIIMDDIWSMEVWDRIKMFFPVNSNGSRIIVTTRLSHVANYLSSTSLELKFMDSENSWDLFREKVFAQESCTIELEQIGKKIAENCKGLPLLIVAIAGLLAAKPDRSLEYWEHVAEDVSSIEYLDDYEHCLKVLSLSYNQLPSRRFLKNLQTLVVRGTFYTTIAPSEIWDMAQLRHIKFDVVFLPEPSSDRIDSQDYIVLENLQTLMNVENFRFSKGVLKKIPNIKKLKITYDRSYGGNKEWPHYCLGNLDRLRKLESLVFLFLRYNTSRDVLLQNLAFPISLKKLEHLGFQMLPVLKEIPLDIGEIPTLRSIQLEYCSDSAVVSAKEILEKQESFGNVGLRVQVHFFQNNELESLASENFQVQVW
ncbi:putative late blight resistance protein homolog r1a-4 [Phtheirospermum japonicum]|uniref:Putative late blight resistance protein homolog r1a-4 n=1 Tax=Phtheirospermum japonicum TaxID=374723 RepID=A0A830C0F0_9LAMI|nr:putative late blight resistance protein homolog r1a-4 [Phtheirospermum japonicum]